MYKATQYWEDIGLGAYGLHYLRDKMKREVDFLITKNNKPWVMVEVKSSANRGISKNLRYFHEQLKPEHTFQVAFDMPFVNKSCFDSDVPLIVPAQTLLSQLV